MLHYIKEGAIFIYTRLTNYTCRILQTCNTVFCCETRTLVTNVVMRATMCFSLQCNNVARQVEVEEKCCAYYRTLKGVWTCRMMSMHIINSLFSAHLLRPLFDMQMLSQFYHFCSFETNTRINQNGNGNKNYKISKIVEEKVFLIHCGRCNNKVYYRLSHDVVT